MNLFLGHTLNGIALAVALGFIIETIRLFSGIYHLHDLMGLIVSLGIAPLTLFAGPVYLYFSHDIAEFLIMYLMMPAAYALNTYAEKQGVTSFEFGKSVIGFIVGIVLLGYVQQMIQ